MMVESETGTQKHGMDSLIEDDEEPFLLRERSDEEIRDYDAGFKAG
jgi:hypothetical protein